MKHKIIIINGPNLNLLGEREKEKYGNFSLKDVENDCLNFSKKNDMEVGFYQSNVEGELINFMFLATTWPNPPCKSISTIEYSNPLGLPLKSVVNIKY